MHTEPLFALLVVRTCPLDALPEFRTMVVMDEMAKFMDNDVIHDPSRSDDDLPVELQASLG